MDAGLWRAHVVGRNVLAEKTNSLKGPVPHYNSFPAMCSHRKGGVCYKAHSPFTKAYCEAQQCPSRAEYATSYSIFQHPLQSARVVIGRGVIPKTIP